MVEAGEYGRITVRLERLESSIWEESMLFGVCRPLATRRVRLGSWIPQLCHLPLQHGGRLQRRNRSICNTKCNTMNTRSWHPPTRRLRQQSPSLLSFRTSRRRPRHGVLWSNYALAAKRPSNVLDTSFRMIGFTVTNWEENGVLTMRFWSGRMIPLKSS